MANVALSDKAAKTAKWEGKDFRLADGNGLYLQIRRSSKIWLFRRRCLDKLTGKYTAQMITLGKYPDGLSLKQARLEAAKLCLDTNHDRHTLEQMTEKYLTEIVDKKHKRPELAHGYMERAVIPVLGKKMVREVTRSELVALIQDYSKRGARTADQLRSNLKALFGYGVELGWCDSNPMLEVSRRVSGYTQKNRERVLSDNEIRLIMSEPHHNAAILRFLLLTGLRISEAQKGHQDGDRWVVPAELSKNGKAHWVYLSESARVQLPFPRSTATNIQAWLRRWCEKNRINPRFTPHDLRRTAATRMADNSVEPFIVERMLNHTMEGVMAVYNRAEYVKERIDAVNELENIIQRVIDDRDE